MKQRLSKRARKALWFLVLAFSCEILWRLTGQGLALFLLTCWFGALAAFWAGRCVWGRQPGGPPVKRWGIWL
jgi:hypothetical protein